MTAFSELLRAAIDLHQQGALAQAELRYRELLEVEPESAVAYNNLGGLYLQQNKLTEAIECFQRALEYHPNYVEALHNLGHVFQTQGRQVEALVCYNHASRFEARRGHSPSVHGRDDSSSDGGGAVPASPTR
jgi:Flp pilus assembly protein TadD